jgi:hypothetical protein
LGVSDFRIKNADRRYNLNEMPRNEAELRVPFELQRRLQADFLQLKKLGHELGIYIE